MTSASDPIGILGGTFDPIHYGHLRLAEEVADACGLTHVLLIPAAAPNLRAQPRTSAMHRLQMTRIAAQGNSRLGVDDRELKRAGTTYTVDTLRELRAQFGDRTPLALILGADAFLRLPAWSRWHQLFELAHIVVATRPGTALEASISECAELHDQWRSRGRMDPRAINTQAAGMIAVVGIPMLDISATDVRLRLKRKASARYLLPQAVLDYIEANNLYESE
jgi:nicotinate-nucleotide adenylyltransferase